MDVKEKEYLDKVIAEVIGQEWKPESCMQEFYSEFFVSPHYEYFITVEKDNNRKDIWIIYDRDLSDDNYKYNSVWENEPKASFSDLAELAFNYKLKNDGRTLCEYICDFNKLDRLVIAKPIDKKQVGKIWKH